MLKAHLTLQTVSVAGPGGEGGGAIWFWRHVLRLGSVTNVRARFAERWVNVINGSRCGTGF